MNLVKLKCENCNAVLEVNSDLNEIVCNYCGSKILIDDEATKKERLSKVELNFRKQNHEQDIIEKRNTYELEKLIKIDKEKQKWKETKWSLIAAVGIFACLFLFAFINSFFYKPIRLVDYNKLNLGMTYEECKEILGKEGHLTSEVDNKTSYVWYKNDCSNNEDCEIIVQLEFENNRLIKRKENGLK